jgi:hypothetical protein
MPAPRRAGCGTPTCAPEAPPVPTPGPRAGGSCGAAAEFHTGPVWATRLPAAFPPYPGGQLIEAAGQQSGECRVRVVTFRTRDAYGRVLEFYRERAESAGYSAEHQPRGADHVLGGVNPATNGAFYLVVTPVEGGSNVSLINNGR